MPSRKNNSVSLFFIATPLHYLAAQKVASEFESGSRCIAVPYTPAGQNITRPNDWDAVVYAPWPRFSPLPGPMGRHRRLLANIREVAAKIGACKSITIHSPVFDTEAINYFLRALPKMCGAETLRARIIPDGLLNISRHPLTPLKLAAQRIRKLRRLLSPELNYWCFSGDRIGSDAPFVDRIYMLAGFPHEYNPSKVVQLPPLVSGAPRTTDSSSSLKSALIVGQPLMGVGALSKEQHDQIVSLMSSWLREHDVSRVYYKSHPRDPVHELKTPTAVVLDIAEPLELHMARTGYDAILGVNSTALYFARQIYGPEVDIVSFGQDVVKFKNPDQAHKATLLMDALGIQRL